MPYAFEFDDGDVIEWSITPDGATPNRVTDYRPALFVVAGGDPDPDRDPAAYDPIRGTLAADPEVRSASVQRRRRGFRHDAEPVLRVETAGVGPIRSVAARVRDHGRPGEFRAFDVDLSPGFRYCLDRGIDPRPGAGGEDDGPGDEGDGRGAGGAVRPLRVCSLAADPADLAGEGPPTELRIEADEVPTGAGAGGESPGADGGGRIQDDGPDDGRAGSAQDDGPETVADGPETVADGPESVVAAVDRRVRALDPDVVVVSEAGLIPALFGAAEDCGRAEFRLGRRPGYRKLAGASTYESYGTVHHSPARYDVPGRAVIDRSNTFLYGETNLAGCLDLVGRSRKPLQEVGWASIGNVLTAIQIREARSRGVLVPWKSRRHELFKPASTLHAADRGGHVVAPDVGLHEDVHELDFASLYPNVIVTRNLSPETVRCDCHPDREDVPGLGYNVCPEEGYLPGVLGPLIDARADCKAELRDATDPARRATLEGRSEALKWILVSCFGYQGFSNAKFGRIECHEAINAHAREILLDAKARLEAGGWRVLHGVVDSLWVTARDDDPEELRSVAAEISETAGIPLEYEGAYDWVAFVPRRDGSAGALTRYFGARSGVDPPDPRGADDPGGSPAVASEGTPNGSGDDGGTTRADRYKFRGIECRQDSTPAFVAALQRDLVRVLDRTRSPAAVCDRLGRAVDRLRAGEVDPARLGIEERVSKAPDEYAHETRTVAALRRAERAGLPVDPGRTVAYVVVDDDADGDDRVALAREADGYDPAFYRDRLVRAAESVLSPLGWDRERIAARLSGDRDATLEAFR